MNTTPSFTGTPRVAPVLVNTADTNTDGTSGTRATVITAAGNGTRVDTVQIKGIVADASTQAADAVRLWIGNGTNDFLLKDVLVAAGGGAISSTVANFETTVALGIDLPAGFTLKASTRVGGALASYHVTAVGGDY